MFDDTRIFDGRFVWLAGTLLLAGLATGCAGDTDKSGGELKDESFLAASAGKADSVFNIQPGSAEAEGVLELVNTASLETLDKGSEIGLDVRAAQNIVDERQDGDISSLQELDNIPWVSRRAFRKLYNYAEANGYFESGGGSTVTLPDGYGSVEIQAPPTGSLSDIKSGEPQVNVVDRSSGERLVGEGEYGDEITVAKGAYTVKLIYEDGTRTEKDIDVDDQQRLKIQAGRVEFDFQDRCNQSAGCRWILEQLDHSERERGEAHIPDFDVTGREELGQGITVLPGAYMADAVTPAGYKIDDLVGFDVEEGAVHEISTEIPRQQAGIKVVDPQPDLPSCVGDFSGDGRFAMYYSWQYRGRNKVHERTYSYPYTDKKVFLRADQRTEKRHEIPVREVKWLRPGRYIMVANGSSTRVELEKGTVNKIYLSRIEVPENEASQFGGHNSYRLTHNETVKEGLLQGEEECPQGTGYNVVDGEYDVRVKTYDFDYEREDIAMEGLHTVENVDYMAEVSLGTPTQKQLPDWTPGAKAEFSDGSLTFEASNKEAYVVDTKFTCGEWDRDSITGERRDRCFEWEPHRLGTVEVGETISVPRGDLKVLFNGTAEEFTLYEGGIKNLSAGRIEVRDNIYPNGIFRVRDTGLQVPTGRGLNVLSGDYSVEIEWGENSEFSQVKEVTVPE
jgi:hypothetical protein